MAKFRLPNHPLTIAKSIRFPKTIIEDIEKEIAGKDCSFTDFIVEAARTALQDLKEERENK